MPKTNSLDFSTTASADQALKKVSQLLGRAGQAVVTTEFSAKPRRASDTTYREALLTLASGQTITLRVNGTGDIYQVALNGSVKPLKEHNDTEKAVAEIAAMAEKNQGAFQKAQARKAVALPKGMSTPKPKQFDVLTQQVADLDAKIDERKATIADLKAKLAAGAMTDAVPSELADNSAAREVLMQLAKAEAHTVEDGDLVSKAARDTLVDLGLVDRDDGDNVLSAKGRACAAMLDAAWNEPAPPAQTPTGLPEPMSFLGFKLVNQAFVDAVGPVEVPSRFQIGANVVIGLDDQGSNRTIPAKVIGANFRASKVHYTLAVPTQAVEGKPMYAVLYDVDSMHVGTAESMLDSANELVSVPSLDAFMHPALLPLASSYVAATELAAAAGVMLDSANTAGARAYLQIGLDVVETNGPISLEAGDLEQARHQMSMAASFRAALAMLDSAGDRQMDDKALEQLVAIAKLDAATEDDIQDQDALATLLAQEMVDVAEGIYFVNEKGRQHLNDNGLDAYGEPFAD